MSASFDNILKYFLIVLVPIAIIISNFKYLIMNKSYYQSVYTKVVVYQNFSSHQVVDKATDNLFGYFRGKNMLDTNFYSSQAVLHLKDVRGLLVFTDGFYYFVLLGVAAVVFFQVVKRKVKTLLGALFISSIITAITIVVFGLGVANAFDNFFLNFHQILFTNTLWLFPADDNLIKLFPQQFFVEFANQLSFNIFISSAVIALVSFLAMKFKIETLKIHLKLKI